LKELTIRNASIACEDWLRRIRPVICNLSKRARQFWTLVERKVAESYKKYLLLSPVEKINRDFKEDEDTNKEEFNRVKAIINELLIKAIPNDLVK
jgi:hypothetical protein